MSSKTLIDQIRHYQKDIERCPENSERMIRCIKRLYVLPILVQHLQETGVGRSVNALRKYSGEVGEAAKALVAKWKAMVAAEESSDGENCQADVKEDKHYEQVKPPKPVESEKVNPSYSYHKDGVSNDNCWNLHRSEEKKDKKSSERQNYKKQKHSKPEKTKPQSDSDENSENSSYKKKRKRQSSPHRRSEHCKSKRRKIKEESDSDNESDSEVCNRNGNSTRVDSDKSQDEDEDLSEVDQRVEDESGNESSSSSEHRHRSRHKSHHKSKHNKSSHSSKEKHHSQKRSHEKHSNVSKKSKSEDLNELIKENEKKIKKEKIDKESCKSPKLSKVKIEKNEDGSIDAGSGASFAEALMVFDSVKSSKKKKKNSTSPQKKPEKSLQSSPSSNSSGSVNAGQQHKSKSSSSKPSSSAAELMKMPELLKKEIKAETLNLDISSTLPEISPHYKPLPHIPESPARRLSRTATEQQEEAMCNIMTTKYQRTKVFSGNKSGSYAVVPSLYSICIQVLYDNVDAVEYTGGVPYEILKPLMEKLNADQLYLIEHHNSYLIEDTDSLWKFHCSKDFRNKQRLSMESWRDLYLRCVDEREQKLKALTANISQSMAKSAPVRQAKLAYVDSVAKPPRSIARKQAKYGTGNSSLKAEIIKKAVVGGHTPGVTARDVVPPPSQSLRATPQIMKKKKAPLMAKALQLIKGNRFKR